MLMANFFIIRQVTSTDCADGCDANPKMIQIL
jgi:hypothetical protein